MQRFDNKGYHIASTVCIIYVCGVEIHVLKTFDFRINQNLTPRNTSCIEHVERHRAGHIGPEDRCGLNGKTTQKDA